jgi:hypothetical protein
MIDPDLPRFFVCAGITADEKGMDMEMDLWAAIGIQ